MKIKITEIEIDPEEICVLYPEAKPIDIKQAWKERWFAETYDIPQPKILGRVIDIKA